MDADGLPIVGSGIDYSKVNAINQKRLLAFVNYFLSRTVQFLNRFSGVCEQKLSDLALRIERLETTMSILETKLSSIPGLDDVTLPDEGASSEVTVPSAAVAPLTTQPQPSQETPVSQEIDTTEAVEPPVAPEPANHMTVKNDPAFAHYFKMVHLGVHPQAVKNKMAVEGVDPELLDTPDAPSPNVGSGVQSGGGMTAGTSSDSSDDDGTDTSSSA